MNGDQSPSQWAEYYNTMRDAILDSGDLADMESEAGQAAFQAIQECDNQLVDLIPDLLEQIAFLQNELVRKEFQS